jgi:hypothetical protein
MDVATGASRDGFTAFLEEASPYPLYAGADLKIL